MSSSSWRVSGQVRAQPNAPQRHRQQPRLRFSSSGFSCRLLALSPGLFSSMQEGYRWCFPRTLSEEKPQGRKSNQLSIHDRQTHGLRPEEMTQRWHHKRPISLAL